MISLAARLPWSSIVVRAVGVGGTLGTLSSCAPRMPVLSTAVVVRRHHSGDLSDTLLWPSLGASVRFASTLSAAKVSAADKANGSSAANGSVVPSAVLFKVGSGTWNPFDNEKLLIMNRSGLLKALKADEMFAIDLKDVKLGACTITVVKNAALPAGVTVPPAALETGDAVIEMEGAKTVGDMAKEVGVSGAPLFVRVGLPAKTLLQEYPPDNAMSRFARGLQTAKEVDLPAAGTDGKKGGTVTLPHGISWPDLSSPVLYVRHFYDDLWGKVLNTCKANRDICDAVIMGTPGIAKSAFGLYALYRAVKAGRTVIYSAHKGGMAVFKGSRAYHFRSEDLVLLSELDDPDALYISDSLPPIARSDAFRLLITSPKKENWSKFVQSPGACPLVLPNFTLPEMLQLREVAFSENPRCSEGEVVERFRRWGGSVRSILTLGGDAINQRRLKYAAEHLTLATIEATMTGMRSLDGVGGSDIVHRLFNIIPLGALPDNTLPTDDPLYYMFHLGQLITDHVVGLFADSLEKKETAEMFRFLHKAARDPASAALRGKLYERNIVVPRFVHGPGNGKSGELQLKRLSPPMTPAQPKWLNAPHLSFTHGLRLVHFRNLAQLESKWKKDSADAIFVPHSKEFPVIDFVLRIGGQALMANATVGESHDIKLKNTPFWDALLQAVGLADTSTEIPFAWILDEPAFERFDDAGQVKSQSGGSLASGITARHHIGSRLAQYKLKLEVPAVIA